MHATNVEDEPPIHELAKDINNADRGRGSNAEKHGVKHGGGFSTIVGLVGSSRTLCCQGERKMA